ncbi:MAG: dihydrolipoamide acetyltransferase family protein [Dehalococcoidia bacterium]|nr:dihydrolipoamide acetyltransferase family protein [Dehalococcoidia bacterium]
MPTKVIMPQLGESVTEGTIGKWLKKPGDRVALYEPLVEVITDKVNVEVPSPAAGVLTAILAPEGATVPVNTDLAAIEEVVGAASAPPAQAPAPASARAPEPPSAKGPTATEEPLVTPVVRRMAAEYGIDVALVKGTGIGGRVTKQDVMRYVEERKQGQTPAPSPAPPASQPTSAQRVASFPGRIVPLPGDQAIPVSAIRRQIAEHVARSTRTIPHAWTLLEVDMSGAVGLRESMKAQFQQRVGVELTYVPFVIRAVVDGLKQHPMMNAVWADDSIIVRKEINIAVAIARDEGLMVPVIRHADQKSIAGLAKALHELVVGVRENRLALQDVQGGTFSVNNPGALGSVASFSIINYPQTAILNMEAIVRRPVAVGDAVVIRPMMNLTLSFDHRVVDGHTAVGFLQAVKRALEAVGPETPVY